MTKKHSAPEETQVVTDPSLENKIAHTCAQSDRHKIAAFLEAENISVKPEQVDAIASKVKALIASEIAALLKI